MDLVIRQAARRELLNLAETRALEAGLRLFSSARTRR
jgi:hypothetical protein